MMPVLQAEMEMLTGYPPCRTCDPDWVTCPDRIPGFDQCYTKMAIAGLKLIMTEPDK